MRNHEPPDRTQHLFANLKDQLDSSDKLSLPDPPKSASIPPLMAVTASTAADERDVCPFLKTDWDDTIWYGFPNEENHCYKHKKPLPVSPQYQEQLCLSSQFNRCAIFQQAREESKLPRVIRRLFLRTA